MPKKKISEFKKKRRKIRRRISYSGFSVGMEQDFDFEVNFEFPEKFQPFFIPMRYKSARGGRGGGKSWAYADSLLALGMKDTKRILCCRELQISIADSVHRLLEDRIDHFGLRYFYKVYKTSIVGINGTEFIFKGVRHNIGEIKSLEGIDYCWVEEAQNVSNESWEILIPTIRKENSEIWLSWNTGDEDDATYQRFVVHPPENCLTILVNWYDNPFFPETLRKEMEYCKRVDPEAYENIWEGKPRKYSEAQIFRNKFIIDTFEVPENIQFYYGADWGFSNDPTVLIRSFIIDKTLYIDYEAYGVGIELDEIEQLFDTVPGSRDWPIVADSSRPDTISYIKRKGFNIKGCNKGSKSKIGFIQDGIEFIKKFEKVVIHPRCIHTADEFRHYSYKKDKNTGEVLPIIIDAFNHCIDSLRYSLEGKIRSGVDWLKVIE